MTRLKAGELRNRGSIPVLERDSSILHSTHNASRTQREVISRARDSDSFDGFSSISSKSPRLTGKRLWMYVLFFYLKACLKFCIEWSEHRLMCVNYCPSKCNHIQPVGTVDECTLTVWRRNYFFILAHPVYKMWKIQEPNTLELWNKLHFEEEKKTESIYRV